LLRGIKRRKSGTKMTVIEPVSNEERVGLNIWTAQTPVDMTRLPSQTPAVVRAFGGVSAELWRCNVQPHTSVAVFLDFNHWAVTK
jgi:hypothetical protein